MIAWERRAAIYLPPGVATDRWVAACLALAEARKLHVHSWAHSWEQLVAMLCAGEVAVGIIGSWAHLDPERIPRVEAAEAWQPPTLLGQRRPTPQVPRWGGPPPLPEGGSRW